MEILGHSSGCQREFAPDALSEVLQDLRLSGAAYCRSELSHPWGLDFPPEEGAVFHFVAEGHCWLRRASHEPPVRLEAGDVVLLPHGAGHALASPADGATKRMDDLPREPVGGATYRLKTGGSGALTRLVCCAVGFEEPTVHPLLELMPDVLLVRAGGEQDPSLSALLEAMAAEVGTQRIGAATVMSRLADIVITRVVRAWVEARARRCDRLARGDPRPAHRQGSCRISSAARGALVGRVHGRRREPVPLRVLGALRGPGRRVARALRRALAHAPGERLAAQGAAERLRRRPAPRIRFGGIVQSSLQALRRRTAQRPASASPAGSDGVRADTTSPSVDAPAINLDAIGAYGAKTWSSDTCPAGHPCSP